MARTQPGGSKAIALALLFAVVLLQLAHFAVSAFCRAPLLPSNYIQLLCYLLAAGVCLYQRGFVVVPAGRRCWMAMALAFLIWSAGQMIYLFTLYQPLQGHWTIRPDDALWVLFGLPLLFAVNTFTEEVTDRVLWLDRLQGLLFVGVLYLLVFLPSVRLKIGTAFTIQDLALLLCALLRLPTSKTDEERRFFMRLSEFLFVYGPLTIAGDALYSRGWQPGSMVDVVWTVPVTLYSGLVLWQALRPSDLAGTSRLTSAVRSLQGLSVSALALLSIGLSAYLATRQPVAGGICIALSFSLFAMRVNARECAWYRAHGQLKQTILQDALTGVGNRIHLRDSLTERLADPAQHDRIVLVFADLDRFKAINDSLGHALGDRFLVEVGERLCAAAPAGSVVCRLGGDEFVVLTSAGNCSEAEAVGETLLNALRPPFRLGTHELRCTASIGVVLAAAGEEADDLLRTADHAMYRAKQLGKNRVQIFDAALRAQMSARWRTEAALREAVEQNRIEVAFQPIFSVEEQGICAFEALARWSHPELGSVPPNEFIPLAEETGLILQLGAQVLEKACRQMAAWNSMWGTSLSVSVNVSPRQFADTGLLPLLLSILERTGLPASLLKLEITESALLVHESAVKHTLLQARAHGIRISLDDFGTGYSSLSFLLSLPVDEVKVDRSFVAHMHKDRNREELVRTVIHLGHSMGKRVVAEGVETEQDLEDLTAMGCECVQGWLISRPLLAEAMEADLPFIAARGRPLTARQPSAPAVALACETQDAGPWAEAIPLAAEPAR